MVKIAYILLCHKDPAGIIRQAERLTEAGDYVAIHFDARAGSKAYGQLKAALGPNPNVTFAARRIKCGWGEWSLVAATLQAVRAAEAAFPEATHFYMLSGDCMPIKTADFIHARLEEDSCDYIESFDFFDSDWIKTGMKEDRLHYRHFFNERLHKRLFYGTLDLQRRLGLSLKVPEDVNVMIGSQWWCLRRRTVEAVLAFCKSRPDVVRFFRTTWIPDETFFQTIVHHLVPHREMHRRTLTFLMFTDYGMPVTFYDDHEELLLAQDFFFARKISSDAKGLRARLGDLYIQSGVQFDLTNEGRRRHAYVTERGRTGRRLAPRFWEGAATMGHGRTLYIVACKKWHVAKRLVAAIRARAGLPALDYLFNEECTSLPDLGGFQSTLAKRTRHRRSLLRMLFEHYRSDRMVICLDTADFDLIRDFYADKAQVRLLEVGCDFTDDYLIGHARRVGLAGPATSEAAMAGLLPTVRFDVGFESDRIRDAGLANLFHLRQSASLEENAVALARFLAISPEMAREIAATDHLFAD
ncbi:MAG: DUF5928 domain-containing protein [Rhodobacteraceae bacterium]|nr:DUF5928 domain-containing protein [Paracoccaceae bacterium]